MKDESPCIVAGYDGPDPAVRALNAAGLLRGRDGSLRLVRASQPGPAETLQDARPDAAVAIAVGKSSQGVRRMLRSAAVSLARRARLPLLIIPQAARGRAH